MWRRRFSSLSRGNAAASSVVGRKWDAIVVGGGHNGLVAAAYLARGGMSVAVLERRHVIGGAAVTEEIVPGFRFSRCSYLHSLLRPSIIRLVKAAAPASLRSVLVPNSCIVVYSQRDLELKRHGLKLLKPLAGTFTPCADGGYLLLGYDDLQNFEEISKFSRLDAEAYVRYYSYFE
ncbi:hypothetical protein MLD38_009253 [Melastoma candidum]|uniref:Uncharacterized protein n=1 Tax=Melastoma candidum TaxID=119954 RepID=A0ACB9RYV5_9MYRT|nr:hypothetical protein MLD38_009253 [Melastoma candidum]